MRMSLLACVCVCMCVCVSLCVCSYLEAAHVPWVPRILQAVLVAFQEEFQEEPVRDTEGHEPRLIWWLLKLIQFYTHTCHSLSLTHTHTHTSHTHLSLTHTHTHTPVTHTDAEIKRGTSC